MTTKIDRINAAYSKLRISGLTVSAGPDEVSLALMTLENMMSELEGGRNICMDYNFEISPELESPTNVPMPYWNMIDCNLAVRLSADFGNDPVPVLVAQASQSLSTASGMSAAKLVQEFAQPSRQPLGSGTTLRRTTWQRFNRQVSLAPPDCATNDLTVSNVNDYREDFSAYLGEESIVSFKMKADPGMAIVSQVNESPIIAYRILAVSTAQTLQVWQQIRIEITTNTERIETRLIDFNIIPRVLIDGQLTT